jgi:hypothetical protein
MRFALVGAVAAAVLVACGAGSAQTTSTALTIAYWENGTGSGEPERWTLRCNPARGTLARPAVACRRLGTASARIFAPVPSSAICTQIYGGPQVARITGSVKGKRVWATFSRQDGCNISRWDGVSPWLLPRSGVTR